MDARRNAEQRLRDGLVTVGGAAVLMSLISAVTYPIAFGSGAVLRWYTGHNFRTVDAVVTVATGPVLFAAIWAGYGLITADRRGQRLRRGVRAQGRWRRWAELMPLVRTGRGTLILEVTTFGPPAGLRVRTWWTPDADLPDVPDRGPIAAPGQSPEADRLRHLYLDETAGTALLVGGVPIDVAAAESLAAAAAACRSAIPGLAVIVLPVLDAQPSERPDGSN